MSSVPNPEIRRKNCERVTESSLGNLFDMRVPRDGMAWSPWVLTVIHSKWRKDECNISGKFFSLFVASCRIVVSVVTACLGLLLLKLRVSVLNQSWSVENISTSWLGIGGLSLLEKFGLGFEFFDRGAPAHDGRSPRAWLPQTSNSTFCWVPELHWD